MRNTKGRNSIDTTREEQLKSEKEYLKVPEVAEFLRIGRTRTYELVSSGEIPSVRIGRNIRVSRGELERWLEGRRQLGIGPG